MSGAAVCACGGDRCQDARVTDGAIRCGRLDDALAIARAAGWTPPGRRPPGKLTDEIRARIVALVQEGHSPARVGREVGFSRSCIRDVMRAAGLRSAHSTLARREHMERARALRGRSGDGR